MQPLLCMLVAFRTSYKDPKSINFSQKETTKGSTTPKNIFAGEVRFYRIVQ